jgi:tetratricopeptide (TPR) repeat protein
MQDRHGQHRFQSWTGKVLFILGLLGDSAIGMLLLTGAGMQLLLLHIPVVFLWASGVNLINKQQMHDEQPIRIGRIYMHKWSIAALLLSWCTFPGFGPLTYSIALFIGSFLHQGATTEMETRGVITSAQELSPALDLEVQPLIDVLHTSDLEMKRAAVAALGRQVNPGAIQLLRQLLSDPQPEIRSDASITLTRLEEDLAGTLNASLELWTADPADKERTLNLADQYYKYACSNVLDELSRHCYFAKARDVLQHCIIQDSMNADLWLKLARIRQHLGETTQALQDVRTALQLQPHSAEAYMLAMELAFRLHAWEILISLAREGLRTLPSEAEARTTLQWWGTPHTEVRGGRLHG